MKGIKGVLTGMLLAAALFVPAATAQAGTIYQSPYVTFSPDGKAFTTCAGDKTGTWYDPETSEVNTGIASTLRALKTGEHYYKTDREGNIPIGKWKVAHKTGICCHDNYPPADKPYHGIKFRRQICSSVYYSGWTSYCADCKEEISPLLIYMSREAAVSITQLDVNLEYYYTCPICTNLEQGSPLGVHMCEKISWNRYVIYYEANTNEQYGGYMERSTHMYNNATEYEGKPITPATHLTKSAYTRIGYEFTGWNTKPNGSGKSFTNVSPTWNLTTENFEGLGSSKGVITLYAQWKRSESTLHIDPAGGSYEGKKGISSYKKTYLETYTPNVSRLQPPKGYTVNFDSKGGNPISAVISTKTFKEWKMSQLFYGDFWNGTYTYFGKDGTSDTLTAVYRNESITLPLAEKDNSSFGGWYHDPECTNPAGMPGDKMTPEKDITLYAKWVELVLTSKDNYTADGGRGAVDLAWQQKDGNHKTYLIYQKREGQEWTKVSSANDITSNIKIEQTFKTDIDYTIPYSGMYLLSAVGAQGGSYGDNKGGAGGTASGTIWLNKGEVLTYKIGGQDGTNGGGKGTKFANGGGCSTITSDQKKSLLIAGGGGGATSQGVGGEGGSTTGNISTGINGEEGEAGGGGGYMGGKAGEYILHSHTEKCWITDDLSYTLFEQMPTVENTSMFSPEFNSVSLDYGFKGNFHSDKTNNFHATAVAKGKASAYANISNVPVKGNTQVEFHVMMDTWNQFSVSTQDPVYGLGGNIIGYNPIFGGLTYVKIYTQDGILIYDNSALGLEGSWSKARENAKAHSYSIENFVKSLGGYWGTKSGWFWSVVGENKAGQCQAIFNETINIPKGTTSLKFVTNNEVEDSWFNVVWSKIRLKGGVNRYTTCGYEEGAIVTSKPAYGGSNYIAPEKFISSSAASGVQTGNGSASIASENIGYLEELSLQGVTATDLASPDTISQASILKEHTGSAVTVTWKEPPDNGTTYYHKAESYLYGSTTPLSYSNMTTNTLTSQIKGYYYLIDQAAATTANNSHTFQSKGKESVEVAIAPHPQYLHLAAVDKAGNISPTVHVYIGVQDTEVAWNLATEKLVISSEKDSVYQAAEPDTYYVRCDGETPFILAFNSRILGEAFTNYQINHTIFQTTKIKGEEGSQVYDIYTPSHPLTNGMIVTNADGLQKEITGDAILKGGSYAKTTRSDFCRKINVLQHFTMGVEQHGKTIRVMPSAGAEYKEGVKYSDSSNDQTNSIYLIGDVEAPTVQGNEILEGMDLINRNDGEIHLNLSASDPLSGVKEFYAEIHNTDNISTKKYLPEADGHIRIEITKDIPIFSGDFQIILYTRDNVGNENTIVYGTTEFSLTTGVSRILEPHDPIFKTGESGILNIVTYGYADRVEVEFPKEMTALNPDLNTTYHYEDFPLYRQEENLQFMIPLYTPLNQNFQITVRAYKDGKQLEDYPSISTIGIDGSVLDEIRTRLR